MDRGSAAKEVMELFLQSVRTFNAMEKLPHKAGDKHVLYHSERHLMDRIGELPGVNVTEFARSVGVTKGAVSQLVKKLEGKGLVKRYKGSTNDKEVFLELTKAGKDLYLQHKKKNDETLRPLIKELDRYPEDKISFLITMFRWINGHLKEGKKMMNK